MAAIVARVLGCSWRVRSCARGRRSRREPLVRSCGTLAALRWIVMVTSEGMVQVGGTTYRVVARAQFHDVFRLLDDACVGTFRHEPCLQIVRHEIPHELLLEVAKQAVRSARLSWSPGKTRGTQPSLGACTGGPDPATRSAKRGDHPFWG